MLPYLIAGAIGYGIAKLFEDDKAPKYADGGLIAPNGKPSNLTPEQYKLVRTPEFKAWFGDWENDPENASKVVDENGEPLVCYHATNNKFWEFSKEKQVVGYYGKGYYFSSSLEKAKDYGKRVIPAFLNIKSVFELSDETPQELLNELAEADIDVEDLGDDNDIEQRSKRTFGYASQNSDIFISNLMKNGFYGIKMAYDLESKIYFFIAFEPNQIKLADGTNTTFDGNNPDIRYAGGGEARPFKDDGNKLVVFNEYRNYTPYKIAVDDVNDAKYITLWKTDTNTGKDIKMGYLRLNNSWDDFLKVSEISIDKGSKGLGLGLLMYKVALKYSSDKVKGIKSYLPDRTNKKQIPKIYRKLNSVKDGDYEFILKEKNPDIRYDGGGNINDDDIRVFEELYHGTSKKRSDEIKSNGFSLRNQGEKSGLGSVNGVSLTSDFYIAQEHSDWASEKFNDEGSVLTIKSETLKILSGSKFASLNSDFEKAFELYEKGLIDGIELCDYETGDGCEEFEVFIFNTNKLNNLIIK